MSRNKLGRKKKELTRIQGKAIIPFNAAIRAEATKEIYQRRLESFLEDQQTDVDTFVERAKSDHNWIQDIVFTHCLEIKEKVDKKELEAGSAMNYLKPLKLLLEMNDIGNAVNWRKAYRVLPTPRRR